MFSCSPCSSDLIQRIAATTSSDRLCCACAEPHFAGDAVQAFVFLFVQATKLEHDMLRGTPMRTPPQQAGDNPKLVRMLLTPPDLSRRA
eukprot:5941810-Amphidinium_carterae.2